MPKVFITKDQKRQSEYDGKNKNIKGEIKKQMDICGIKPCELTFLIGIKEGTFYNRLKKPDQFTLKELRILRDKLNIDLLTAEYI